MYKQQSTLFMICETPLHAGSGDDLGIVDLPIQRERHTSFPKVESSSLKGALREAFETEAGSKQKKFSHWDDPDVIIHRFFGFDDGGLNDDDKESPQNKSRLKDHFKYLPPNATEKKEGHDHAGSLIFTDARLLLFPVKSMKGVFVWLTCRQILNKFASDLAISAIRMEGLDQVKSLVVTEGNALSSSDSPLIHKAVVLEEYAFEAEANKDVAIFAQALAEAVFSDPQMAYWKNLLPRNLVILSDNDFRDFTLMSTEVITRTKIDNETGTVQDGALFTEEYLPTDSVMYSMIFASDEYGKRPEKDRMKADEVMDYFEKTIGRLGLFQLGGNATLGKGIMRAKIKKGGNHG